MNDSPPKERFYGFIIASGWIISVSATYVALRLTYEHTVLTLRNGPQMVGFALLHGPGLVPVFLSLLSIIWMPVAIVLIIVRVIRKSRVRMLIIQAAIISMMFGLQSVPEEYWRLTLLNMNLVDNNLKCQFFTEAGMFGQKQLIFRLFPDCQDKGAVALYNASLGGHLEIVRYLAEQGTDYDYQDPPDKIYAGSHNDTPLMVAAGAGHAEIVEYLLEIGADPQKLNARAETAYDQAKKLDASPDPQKVNAVNPAPHPKQGDTRTIKLLEKYEHKKGESTSHSE